MNVVAMKEKKRGSKGGTPVDPELAERAERARTYLNQHHSSSPEITWDSIAREMGGDYKASTLSVFAGGSYPAGSVRNIVEALERWRELREERQALVLSPGFVQTSVARRILTALRQTRTRGHMGMVATESGLGKSKALRWFCANDPRAIYIHCSRSLHRKGIWPVLIRILVALGLGNNKRSSPMQANLDIVSSLTSQPRLLIFDEANFLDPEPLDELRCIHEEAAVPMFLAGNEQMYELANASGMHPAAFTQFSSRVTVSEEIKRPEIKVPDAVLVAAEMIGPELAEKFTEQFYAQTQQPGAFRALVSLLQRANEIGRGRTTEETITKALAEQARRGGAR